jgi:hypothetical protein
VKKTALWIIVFPIFLLTGCSQSKSTPTGMLTSGIQIMDLRSTVGLAEENVNQQVVSYNVTLLNPGPDAVTLLWLEPVLQDPISKRVLDKNLRIMVDQTMAPNSPLVVTGTFNFDTSGLTKTEIASWGSFFSGVTISSEQTLSLQLDK